MSELTVHCHYHEMVFVNELKEHPKNPNKHENNQVKRLAKILEYQGFRHPIVVSNNSGFIVAGHGRLYAAQHLNIKQVPVTYQDFQDGDAEYAFLVADNAIAEWSDLDLSWINDEVQDLGPDFDLEWLGLKNFQVEPADKVASQTDEDETPSEPDEPNTKQGDLIELGNHRLLCGDATNVQHVDNLMNGENADIMLTSPPYNLGENAKMRGYNASGKDSAYATKSDHKTQDHYKQMLFDFTNLGLNYADNLFINLQLLSGNKEALPEYWHKYRNHLVDLVVWDKEHAAPQLAERVLNSVFEFVFILTKNQNPSRAISTGPEFRGTLKNIYRLNPVGKKDELAKDHGAVFPVAFAEHFISNFSKKSVIDPFGGSGSTLIACEKTNRKCFMMELEPKYCDVIIERWLKYTGKQEVKINGETVEWKKGVSNEA